MNNKDINKLLDEVKNRLVLVLDLGMNYFFKASRMLRLCVVSALFFSSLQVWADSADMSVGINLAPISAEKAKLPEGLKLNFIKYNKDEYLLAYNVFVMNGSVELAFDLARSAVKQNPKSILWRKKLANVALWSGHGEVALQQWIYFIDNNINPKVYTENALKLASQLNDYDTQASLIHRQLIKSPNDKQLILQYSKALQNQGYPSEALKFLQQIPNVENDPQYLFELANIAKSFDDPVLEMTYLKKLQTIDKTNKKASLQLAELLYSQGQLSAAFEVYNSIAKQPRNKIAFWRGYAALAMITGESAAAVGAYKELLNKDAIDTSSLLQMIQLEAEGGQSEAAYKDAIAAFDKTHNFILIPEILSIGEKLNKWQELSQFLAALSPKELAQLENKPEMALLLINIKVHLGLFAEARKAWIWVFNRWPNLSIVQQAYVWYLLDTHDMTQLQYTLDRWKKVFLLKPELWEVYAAALSNTGNYREALEILLRHRAEVDKSPVHLTEMTDLLTQNNFPYEAYYIGQKALYLLQNEINKQTNRLTYANKLLLIQLLQLYGPATVTYNLVETLNSKLFKDPTADEQVLSWALKSESYSMASTIVNIHKINNMYTPPWMTLTLALVYNDRDQMAKLLFNKDVLLSYKDRLTTYRDRVTAASRTGNLKLAEEFAYVGLEEHPKDNDMYKLFEDTMLPRANKSSIGGGYFTPSSVGGPYGKASLRMFLTPSLEVTAYGTLWDPRLLLPSPIAWAPTNQTTGLSLRKYIDNGWVQGYLAERSSVQEFMVAKFKYKQNITSKTDILVGLNYHTIANETSELILAGMKNNVDLRVHTILDNYNLFDAQFVAEQFYGQDSTYLGSGEELELHWQNKFTLKYPDWNINFYGTWTNFQNSKRRLSPKMQRFIPIDPTNDSGLVDPTIGTEFFMPFSYKEVAVTFGFGQEYNHGYTHDWKLFAEAGLLYTWPFGLGQVAEAGIGGSVFGRDHLALFSDYSFNQQQASQKYLTIGIRYDNYF